MRKLAHLAVLKASETYKEAKKSNISLKRTILLHLTALENVNL